MYGTANIVNGDIIRVSMIGIPINHLFKELSPSTFDKYVHNGLLDYSPEFGNGIAYPATNKKSACLVTYLKAGTIDRINTALNSITRITLKNPNIDISLRIAVEIISYLNSDGNAANSYYSNYSEYASCTNDIIDYFKTKYGSIISKKSIIKVINKLTKKQILDKKNNKLYLHIPSVIYCTDDNAPTKQFERQAIKDIIKDAITLKPINNKSNGITPFPKYYTDKSITDKCKILLHYICNYLMHNHIFIKDNNHVPEFFHTTNKAINRMLSRLVDKGYIKFNYNAYINCKYISKINLKKIGLQNNFKAVKTPFYYDETHSKYYKIPQM